jgi:hypothetical protein
VAKEERLEGLEFGAALQLAERGDLANVQDTPISVSSCANLVR